MKKNILTFLFFSIFTISNAQNKLFPQAFFDKKLAEEMLGFGTSTIEGVASTKQKNGYGFKAPLAKKQYAPKGTVVTLFPLTPYFEEFLKLRRQKENKKNTVHISEEAFKYRVEKTTDEYGRFSFIKMKPGKYYIESIVNFTAKGSYRQQTGTINTYNSGGYVLASTPHYETFIYNYDAANRESKIVEIKSDGEILEIKL